MSVKDQIRPAVEGPLRDLGLLVEDVAVTPAGKRRLVRIWIDRVLDGTGRHDLRHAARSPSTRWPTPPAR